MKEFVEKLIERLEEKRGSNYDDNSDYGTGKWCAFDESIEIVNQLAEECKNDVCEWKVVPYYRIPDCGTRYIVAECLAKNFKYCPYCGKKIKIAPYQPKGE